MQSVADRIYRRMSDGAPNKVWTARDFVDIGARSAIDVALHRLHATTGSTDRPGPLTTFPTSISSRKAFAPDHKSVIDGRRQARQQQSSRRWDQRQQTILD